MEVINLEIKIHVLAAVNKLSLSDFNMGAKQSMPEFGIYLSNIEISGK